MRIPERLTLSAVPGIPLLKSGDDLGGVIIAATVRARLEVGDGDIFVVAQKAVSKAQGRAVAAIMMAPRSSPLFISGIPGTAESVRRSGIRMAQPKAARSRGSTSPP